jgi:hypothetical protein
MIWQQWVTNLLSLSWLLNVWCWELVTTQTKRNLTASTAFQQKNETFCSDIYVKGKVAVNRN